MRVHPENELFEKSVTWGAPLLAFVIGFLRSLRDDKDFIASVIEGGLLGLAAFGVQPVFSYIGLLFLDPALLFHFLFSRRGIDPGNWKTVCIAG